GIQVRNNLVVACTQGMVFIDSKGDLAKFGGPGDGAALLEAWTVGHNWREGKPGKAGDKGTIPPAPTDEVREQVKLLSTNPDRPESLRPDRDSPLGAAGAGKEEPALPAYVGAVPPEGGAAWDWSRTWKTWPAGKPTTP